MVEALSAAARVVVGPLVVDGVLEEAVSIFSVFETVFGADRVPEQPGAHRLDVAEVDQIDDRLVRKALPGSRRGSTARREVAVRPPEAGWAGSYGRFLSSGRRVHLLVPPGVRWV